MGSSSNGGASTGSSTTVGLTEALSEASEAGSAGSSDSSEGSTQTSPEKTTQELLIDQTLENPNIPGMILIIMITIIVIGTYYREDIKKMIKKSK